MTNLERLLTEVKELDAQKIGCTDINCIFTRNDIGTNGGCKCRRDAKVLAVLARARTLLPKMAKIIEQYHQAVGWGSTSEKAFDSGVARQALKCAEEIAGG